MNSVLNAKRNENSMNSIHAMAHVSEEITKTFDNEESFYNKQLRNFFIQFIEGEQIWD